MDAKDLVCPQRSERYLIVEIVCFLGRTDEAKRDLIRTLFARAQENLDLPAEDLEIVILEAPMVNWGIRGLPGDRAGAHLPGHALTAACPGRRTTWRDRIPAPCRTAPRETGVAE